MTVFAIFFSCPCLSASVRANIIDRIRDDNDGRHRRYGSPTRRRWYRFTLGHIFDSLIRFLLYSGLFTSTRILVYRTRHHLSPFNTFHVPSSYPLLDHKFECCLMGNSRGPSEKDQKGSFKFHLLHIQIFLSFIRISTLELSNLC